jgi:hypothetical protein
MMQRRTLAMTPLSNACREHISGLAVAPDANAAGSALGPFVGALLEIVIEEVVGASVAGD